MEEKNLWDKTLIIFTADHGESLGEHKESAHGFFIYDSDIRVPLILRFPEGKYGGHLVSNQVKSIDIMPTVLHLLDEKMPESVQGTSLLPVILDSEAQAELSAYSETYWPRYHYGWSELKSLRKGRYKFIDAPHPELYDTLEDPGEVNNLVNKKASLGHELKRELLALIEASAAQGIEEVGPKKIDDDSLVKLQALGYIGSFHSKAKEKEGQLADPKDKIELYNEIKLSQFLVTEEKMDEAERKIKDVLEKDPSVLEARYILGNIFSKQDKFDEAIEEYRKALEVDPDYYEAIFGMALTYKKAGMTEEAIVGFKRMVEIDSRDSKSFLHLGDIYLERGQLEEAMKYLKSGIAVNPEAPVFHNNLGAVYLKMNMFAEAEQEIEKALSIERSIPLLNAHFNKALLHEARGEMDLAVLEYKREQEASPFNYKPDYNLGLLYVKANDLEKAIKEFQSCLEKNDKFANAYIFLAKAYMDSGRDLEEAERYAKNGLSLKPDLKSTILGHFVLADICNRLGRYQESQQHVTKAKQLQKTFSPED